MANPQTENGYTKIANEILEKLSTPGINGSEHRVILIVIRKTYGFHKKKDRISLSQFQKYTLMNRVNVVRTIQSLVAKRILLKEGNVYKFNKNWEEWVVVKRLPSSQKATTPVVKRLPEVVAKRLHTKESIKDIYTKESTTQSVDEVNEYINLFKAINPTINFGNTTTRKATQDLIKQFGADKATQYALYAVSIFGKPYSPTITTPYQLKVKLSELVAYSQKEKTKGKINIINLDNL